MDGGSSEPVKPSNIHYWDGQSSATTPSNLDLWKEVLEEVKKDKFSIVISSPSYFPNNTSGSTFVLTTIPGNGNTQINSLTYSSTVQTTPSKGERSYVTYRDYVTLTITDNVLTAVGEKVRNSTISPKYISTENYKDMIPFEPTQEYHPATKKYVDGRIANTVKSNDGSVMNWVTMTKAEFEAAKENDTIEDGTVINVLDDFEVGAGNFNIFYWDGQSSSTNSDNLYLWRSAIQAAEDYGCSMVLEKDPGNSNPKGPIIYYFTKEDLPTSSVTIYSTCFKNTSGNIYTKGNVSNAELYRRSVTLTFSNGTLSSVGAGANSILTAKSYLTTETLATSYDGKYFTPSKSYQPVSKGYLETQMITTQKTSKTCELPTNIT